MIKFWAKYFFVVILSIVALYLFVYLLQGISPLFRMAIAAIFVFVIIVYTFVMYRYGSGIDRVNGRVAIPTLSGRVILDPDHIDFLEISKWMIGRAFDFSHAKIVMKDGTEISLNLPDAVLREARLT